MAGEFGDGAILCGVRGQIWRLVVPGSVADERQVVIFSTWVANGRLALICTEPKWLAYGVASS